MANVLYQSLQPWIEEGSANGNDTASKAVPFSLNGMADEMALPPSHMGGGASFSTSELNAPQYSTDEFRMFNFKVTRCSKRYVHDWRSCPFAHPTENARRRDPRLVRYLPVPCPDYKRGICLRGDGCPYSHGVYECWLHPAKYRTQLCKEGPHCHRPVCFFAHSVNDLRQPTHLYNDLETVDNESAAQMILAATRQMSTSMGTASGGLSSDGSEGLSLQRMQNVEETMNNLQPAQTSKTTGSEKQDSELENNNNADALIIENTGEPSRTGLAPSVSVGSAAQAEEQAQDAQHASERNNNASVPYGFRDKEDSSRCSSYGEVNSASNSSQQQLSLEGEQARSCLETSSKDAPTSPLPKESQNSHVSPNVEFAMDDVAAATSRLSLDSAQKVRTQAGALPGQQCMEGNSSWAQGMAASATAAVALAGIPVNEQPLLPNQGPRMSNAVARKLGLVPSRSQSHSGSAPDPRFARRDLQNHGIKSPRDSFDSGSFSAVTSPTYGQLQQRSRGSMDSGLAAYGSFPNGAAGYGGHVASPMPASSAAVPVAMNNSALYGVNGLSSAMPYASQAQINSIHPALLSLVAANLSGQESQNVQMDKDQQSGSLAGMMPSSMPLMHQINTFEGANALMMMQHQRHEAVDNGSLGRSLSDYTGNPSGIVCGSDRPSQLIGNDAALTNNVANLMTTLSQLGVDSSILAGSNHHSHDLRAGQLFGHGNDSMHNNGHPNTNAMAVPHRGSSDEMLGASSVPQGPYHGESMNEQANLSARQQENSKMTGGSNGDGNRLPAERFHLPHDLSADMLQHIRQSV